jgi:hypothetical protein
MERMKLYWVTTEDHHEDWFMIAPSTNEAAKLYEEFEGYDMGAASAQEILGIPDNLQVESGWPSEDILLSLGAIFIQKDEPRIIEINGKQFTEGMLEAHFKELDDDIFELRGVKRLNQTKKTDQTKH